VNSLSRLVVIAGWLAVLSLTLFAATSWGGGELLLSAEGIGLVAAWETWFGLPYLLFWFLLRRFETSARCRRLLLLAVPLGALLPVWFYVDAIFRYGSSASVMTFALIPAGQLLFLGLLLSVCLWLAKKPAAG
jgi:hypothetical protein